MISHPSSPSSPSSTPSPMSPRLIPLPVSPSPSDSAGIKEDFGSPTSESKIHAVLAAVAQQGVILTLWDSLLLEIYDVPAAHITHSFLVDDPLLESACQLAKENGFRSIESNSLVRNVYGDYDAVAHHFANGKTYMNLYPASYAGFHADELSLISFQMNRASQPVPVYVAKRVPLIACYVRKLSSIRFGDMSRTILHYNLSSIIAYGLFDMSYEGDYMSLDFSQEEMETSVASALEQYRKWEGWRDDEIWIADAMEWIIQGKARYEYLPCKSQYN